MPGVAPMDSACYLVWALARGRTEEARVALRLADPTWNGGNLGRCWSGAARALLADAAGVDAAIAAATGPMLLHSRQLMRIYRSRDPRGRSRDQVAARSGRPLRRHRGGRLPGARPPAAARCRRASAASQAGVAAVPAELASRGVTAREAEVLRLLGEGLSNCRHRRKVVPVGQDRRNARVALLAKLHLRSRGPADGDEFHRLL